MSRPLAVALLASTALMPAELRAQALPTGGQVAAGAAVINTPAPGAMTITQTSDRAVINWQDFSVGAGGSVDIRQPGSHAALLNRVTGSATSAIAGQITANGLVYLVNPNGILITETGSVNAAGFVASTLGLSDDAFMKGEIVVTGVGGSVVNRGTITILKGGYAALLGGRVENSGLILAPLGTVALGAGTRVTLDLEGNGFLQVALPAADGGILMSGRIVADGGAIVLSAAQAVDAARSIVNLSGSIAATGVGTVGGTVVLTGGDIALAGASIDVSGTAGGGSVRIGGDATGGGTLAHADTLRVDAASTIRADATAGGDGGTIVLWSDSHTAFAGTISATGRTGGDAEVSSKGRLDYTGTTDLTGATFGTLLLDPYNLTISNGTSTTGGGFTANGNDSILNAATLSTALATANVTVSTGSSGTQDGTITVAAPISWSSGSTLTLSAANSIAVNADITAGGAGGVMLNWNTASGDLTFAQGASLSFTGSGGSLSVNGSAYTLLYSMAEVDAIDTTGLAGNYALARDLDASGTSYTQALVATADTSPFTGTLEGLGHTISNLTIASTGDFAGLIGALSGTVRDIGMVGGTVSGRYQVGGLVGYNRSGTVRNAYATGTVGGTFYVGGLVGFNSSGTVSSVHATGAVSALGYLGGLVGYNNSGTVRDAYATGTVSGATYAGGLVGYNNSGTVSDAYATGTVSGPIYVGGLVGLNYRGSVNNAYATGAVSGSGGATGGLVGMNDAGGTISNSHATGAVSGGGDRIGGLLGDNNFGTVSNVYAVGAVTSTANYVGGLVGFNADTVSNAYATGAASGVNHVGGLAGYVYGTLSNVYATGAVRGTGGRVGGVAGEAYGLLSNVYATGAVSGTNNQIGGILGANSARIANGYWDSQTTGQTAGIGRDSNSQAVTSLTTQQFQNGDASALGGAFSGGSAGLYPYLSSFFPNGVQAISGTATTASGAAASAAQVGLYAAGAALGSGTISTGANGYYYTIVPTGTLTGATTVLGTTLTLAGTSTASGIAYADGLTRDANGNLSGLSVVGGRQSFTTGLTTLTALSASAAAPFGASYANLASTLASTPTTITAGGGFAIDQAIASLADLAIASNGALTLDASIDLGANALSLTTGSGAITQAAGTAITAGTLTGSAGSVALTNAGNAIATLDGFTAAGSFALTDSVALTLSGVITAQGAVTLATTDAFVNTRGSDAIAASQWTIYSATSGGNMFGALDSGNLAIWGTAAGATLSASGNRYVFAEAAGALTFTPSATNKTYGNALTIGTVEGADFTVAGYRSGVAGAYRADSAASAWSGTPVLVSTGSAAGAVVKPGGYAITLSGVSGINGYTVDASATGVLTIDQRPVTVTADALSRLYGDANPALSYASTALGAGIALSGSLATNAVATSNVGGYAITRGTLSDAANGNYALTYVGADMTVAQRPVTVTADALSRLYGDANPALSYAIDGLVNGDMLTGALATGATAASGIGGYAIGQGSVAASDNYAVRYVGAILTITPRALAIVADDKTRPFGATDPALTYRIGARGLVNGDTLTGALATSATSTSAPGLYAIVQGTLAASPNYAIDYTPGTFALTAAVPDVGGSTPPIPQVAPPSGLGSSVARDGFAADTAPESDDSTLRDESLNFKWTIGSEVCPSDHGCGPVPAAGKQ